MRMRPALGGMKPAMAPSSVDLPDPDGPISEKNSPGLISIEIGCSAATPPYRLLTPSSTRPDPCSAMLTCHGAAAPDLQQADNAQEDEREDEDERRHGGDGGGEVIGQLLPDEPRQRAGGRTGEEE